MFGVKNIEEIKSRIFDELLDSFEIKKLGELKKKLAKKVNVLSLISNNQQKLKTAKNVTDSTIDVVYDGITSFFNINVSEKYMYTFVETELDNRYFLVFDDFERTNIDTIELLGFINEFVEHKNIKTLIIANQKEVRSYKRYENIELKYLVALQEKTQKYTEKNTKTNLEQNKCYSLDYLNTKVDSIFKNDKLYKQTNEKVIGKVFEYKPNLETVFKIILDKLDDKHKNIINTEDCIKFVLQACSLLEHENIRTVKCILENYDLYIKNVEGLLTDINDLYKCDVFKSIAYTTIVYKKKGYIELDKNNMITNVNLISKSPMDKYNIMYGYKTYRSVIEFVTKNNFNIELFQAEYDNYIQVLDNEILNTDYWEIEKLMYDWLCKSDKEIIKTIEVINYKIENDLFSLYSSLLALKYLYILKYEVGLTVDYIDILESKINTYIESSEKEIVNLIDTRRGSRLFSECSDRFIEKRDEIKDLIINKNLELTTNNFINQYNVEDYGVVFKTTVENVGLGRLKDRVDVETVVDLIEKNNYILEGDNENLVSLRYGIDTLFFEYTVIKDKLLYDKVINLFKNSLDSCDTYENQNIKKYLLKNFVKEFEEKMANVNNNF